MLGEFYIELLYKYILSLVKENLDYILFKDRDGVYLLEEVK